MDNIVTIQETKVRRIYAPDDHEFIGFEVTFVATVMDPTIKGSVAEVAAAGIAQHYGMEEACYEKTPSAETPTKQPDAPSSGQPSGSSSEEAPAGARRRRGATEQQADAPAPTAAQGEPGEPSGRRRRGSAAASTETAAAGAEAGAETPSPEGARRRRREPEPAPEPVKAPEPTNGEVSDADLVKAASSAATILTPNVVKEVIALFQKADGSPCVMANDIQAHERMDFLASLKAEIAEAKG